MLVRDFIKAVHREYQGDIDYPEPSDEEYSLILGFANDHLEDFATDPDNMFRSRWEERTLGTVTSSRTYSLAADIWSPSDFVFVTKTDGSRAEFTFIEVEQRNEFADAVYMSGENPKRLTFTGSGTMAADLIGGTMSAGCYIIPRAMTSPTGYVPVARPRWLVLVTAASLAANDAAKEDRVPDLLGLAEDQWNKMTAGNRKPVYAQQHRVRYIRPLFRRRF